MSHIASTQYFSIKLQRSKIQHRNRMAYRIVYWNTKQLEKDLYRAHTYDTGLTTAINFKKMKCHYVIQYSTCQTVYNKINDNEMLYESSVPGVLVSSFVSSLSQSP